MTQNDILSAALERHQRALEASYALQRERLAQLTTELETTRQAERDIAERARANPIRWSDADREASAATARQWAEHTVTALKAILEGKSE